MNHTGKYKDQEYLLIRKEFNMILKHLCVFFKIFSDCDEIIADLIIITDNSGSVGSSNYATEKAFAITLANAFEISPTETRVGWVDYSTGINTAINLNSANFDSNLEVTRQICQRS